MSTFQDFLDSIGDNPITAFLIAAVFVVSVAVWINLKVEDRKRQSHLRRRRECSELERLYRI